MYREGDYAAICDRCGFRFQASELKRDWQGLRVCADDFEERHPQDFIRAVRPDKAPYGAKSLGPVHFIPVDLILQENGGALILQNNDGLLALE